MFSGKGKILLFILIFISFSKLLFAQQPEIETDQLRQNIEVLRSYFIENNNWHVVKKEVGDDVDALLHYVEDERIGEIIKNLNDTNRTNDGYVMRLPENVEDSLSVPGFVPYADQQMEVRIIESQYQASMKPEEINVPPSVRQQAENLVEQIPEGQGMQLIADSVYAFPEELYIPEVIPDSVLNSPEMFNELVRRDSLRREFVEEKRISYNDSLKTEYIKSYQAEKYDENLRYRIRRYKDEVKLNNYNVLKEYNDQVVAQVNDSIKAVLDALIQYADYIDTTQISFVNLYGEREDILLQNGHERYSRIWLKNQQNDSLAVMVKNTDNRTVQMLIDDGVTFSRFKEKQTKDFDFGSLKPDFNKFKGVGKSYELETPWNIGGDGSIGLTQTYLDNWKKGGKSSLASLMVLKGFANYSRKDGKIKWENSAEFRNGWIKPGGEDSELQKNDDKFELTSRYGISAFKKWYYSAELNFNTQIFRGYNYPKADNPDALSAFMAPSTTYLKVGLDYKPNKNVSLLLSPLTMKNVYVRDTALVDQTSFGIDSGRKAFWEPGLNADLTYKTNLTEDISYETKYKMFINYKDPFKKFDLNWENNFKMALNSYIDLKLMLHFIYDDDVMFPIYDSEGSKIGEEAKLQVKEFFTIGFSYKINRKVMRTHRIR
ncbi:DUF3078 domain-containing protein [Draconibacterium sp. IB214405]|uniref:DUF3078 domain-containing protein n=1 Tax=Draconibacterium sp. IB214405 TaxID=3097352 RepID=UPI002A117FE1|nr:DUF3078 domain-containing protein [Draconibacterium sp. IB214405]MDX8339672.1 DUF3078 domain-containing protein [Draconibacterium sp. IB214405]